MQVRTSTLTNQALNWAVAKSVDCELVMSHNYFRKIAENAGWDDKKIEAQLAKMDNHACFLDFAGNAIPVPDYCNDWNAAGRIINNIPGYQSKSWMESKPDSKCEVHIHNYEGDWVEFGPTLLIASMRCFVASRLGDMVDVPEELLH